MFNKKKHRLRPWKRLVGNGGLNRGEHELRIQAEEIVWVNFGLVLLRVTYLLRSAGGMTRPLFFRMCTSLTWRRRRSSLGKGGTPLRMRLQPRHMHWNSASAPRSSSTFWNVRARRRALLPLGLTVVTAWPVVSFNRCSLSSLTSSNMKSHFCQQHSKTTSACGGPPAAPPGVPSPVRCISATVSSLSRCAFSSKSAWCSARPKKKRIKASFWGWKGNVVEVGVVP